MDKTNKNIMRSPDYYDKFQCTASACPMTCCMQWRKGGITYEKLRKSVCVVFRMMGYADDDILEYMENCFEDVIWPWEYYSLLV